MIAAGRTFATPGRTFATRVCEQRLPQFAAVIDPARFTRDESSPIFTEGETDRAPRRHLRVAIVEDSLNIRERLVELVEDDQRMQVVGEADTEDRAIAMCRDTEPDAIILDLKLAHGTGIGVLKQLGYGSSERKPVIIVLTNFPGPAFERAARALGADWFLDKTSEFHKLRELLRDLL